MSTTLDAHDVDVGDLFIWTRLRFGFMLLKLDSRRGHKDLADWSLEDLRYKIKKMLPMLKDIHRFLHQQESILKQLAEAHAKTMHADFPKLEKSRTRYLICLELCRAQLADDVAQEKHWQQLYDDSWKGEVRPVLTKKLLLKARSQLCNWRQTWANSYLVKLPNFARRMQANSAALYDALTEELPIVDLEEQGLKMEKKLRAAIVLQHPTAPLECIDTMIEAFQDYEHTIATNQTRLQDMQEHFDYWVARAASLCAHIYKRTHAGEIRRWTPWWKQRHGLKMPACFLKRLIPPVDLQPCHNVRKVKEFDISSTLSGMSNATTLVGM
jgi:hypothetical protein